MLKADQPIFPNTFPKTSFLDSVPTREDVLFANCKGEENARIREAAKERIGKLSAGLSKLLTKDEVVLYTAAASAPMNALETYTLGSMGRNASRVTLVFTQQRILAFRVDRQGNWRSSVRGCAYPDLSSTKIGGWLPRYLQLRFNSGTKISFGNLRRGEAKTLKQVLPMLQQSAAGQLSGKSDMVPYCPTCSAELTPRIYECGNCHQLFRNESSLWWRALIPGGAYFYAKQGGLGTAHAIGDTFLTLYLLVVAGVVLSGATKDPNGTESALAYIFVLAALEKLIAVYHARRFIREFIPIEGTSHQQNLEAASTGATGF
jgi:hypothetical protein